MIDNSVFVPAMIVFFAVAAVTVLVAAYGLTLTVRDLRAVRRQRAQLVAGGRELVRAA